MTTSKVLPLLLLLALNCGCVLDLHPETIVRGQVILNGSDEPISNAAIIIRQIHVTNTIPQNTSLVSSETILCDAEGYFEHKMERMDSASNFTIVAALWDEEQGTFVGQNRICRIGEWVQCSGLNFGEVYEDFIIEITDL